MSGLWPFAGQRPEVSGLIREQRGLPPERLRPPGLPPQPGWPQPQGCFRRPETHWPREPPAVPRVWRIQPFPGTSRVKPGAGFCASLPPSIPRRFTVSAKMETRKGYCTRILTSSATASSTYCTSHPFRKARSYFDVGPEVCIIEAIAGVEEAELAGWRWFSDRGNAAGSFRRDRVVEPELDMARISPRPSPFTSNLMKVVRWLAPEGSLTGAPMRSVARELEEEFPSGDG